MTGKWGLYTKIQGQKEEIFRFLFNNQDVQQNTQQILYK